MSLIGAIATYAEDSGNPNNTASLTHGRYYPNMLPNDPSYPAVTLTDITTLTVTAHDRTVAQETTRIQFDIYAKTRSEADTIAALLFSSFNGLNHVQIGSGNPDGGVYLKSALRDNQFSELDTDIDRWRVIQDYFFNV